MEIPFGLATARIVSHTVRDIGDKEAVVMRLQHPCGEMIDAYIWLSPKAMGMARAALKKCGFDPDTLDIDDLVEKPTLLEGNEVEIMVEDYKGRRQASINLRTTPPENRLKALSKALRDAKKRDEEEPTPPADEDSIPF